MKHYKFSSTCFAIVLMECVCFASANSFAQDGRFTVRGLTGSATYGDLDALVPLKQGCDDLWYADIQGKYAKDDDWFAGLGGGYRRLSCNRIYGGDLFVDHAQTEDGHPFWVVSPGIETIAPCWDTRINGYIPFKRRLKEHSFFPSGLNDCGIHGDCNFVEFRGHQQFEHRFLSFEEVGPGVDASVGLNIPCLYCASVHGGVYYYHMRDAKNVSGAAARFDLPVTANWAITSEASYDNKEHAAVAVGLRFQLGHTPKYGCCPTMCDRLYDPIYRHIGPIQRGTGVPVVKDQKDEGLFLRRDNIFFFSKAGRAMFGDPTAGTFENPFAANQFTQPTVDAIGANANLYFSTGTYLINNTPIDGLISLGEGQSIFGRTLGFKCTAERDERPILDGGFAITNGGVHTLDSVQIENVVGNTNTDTIVNALLLDNAKVHLCNDVIIAESDSNSNNIAINAAVGLSANNSTVIIDRTRIDAIANYKGTANITNAATAIGSFNNPFSGNIFSINCSSINSTAVVFDNLLNNFAAGIGNDVTLGTNDFTNNVFSISCSSINSLAQVRDTNMALGNNFATGIGNNSVGTGTITNFTNNKFTINDSSIASNDEVGNTNENLSFVTSIGNNAAVSTSAFEDNNFFIDHAAISSTSTVKNMNTGAIVGTGIGNNDSEGITEFTDNTFSINCSTVSSISDVLVTNNAVIISGIGNNNAAGSAAFSENVFAILNSKISSTSQIGDNTDGLNFVTAIGGNFQAVFSGNIFSISDSSINSLARSLMGNGTQIVAGIGNNVDLQNVGIAGNFINNDFSINNVSINSVSEVVGASGFNFATDIGINDVGVVPAEFRANLFAISNSSLSASAVVTANNTNDNFARSIGINLEPLSTSTFTNNTFTVDCTTLDARAIVRGSNLGSNLAQGVDFPNGGNTMDISNSIVNAFAQVVGNNTGINTAIGLSAIGPEDIIRIFDSIVNVTALANGTNNAIATQGNVVAKDTVFTVRNS